MTVLTSNQRKPDVQRTAPHGSRSGSDDRRRSDVPRGRRRHEVRGPSPRLTVTVLVPAHNESATIGDTVWAVRNQTYPVDRVIVVADACHDDTAVVARRAGATVYEADCRDKAAAQNTVLDAIDTDLLVGFDADTVPDRRCIERMVDRMHRDDLDAACATIMPLQAKGMFIRARRYAYALGRRWWRQMQSGIGRVQVLTGAAYLFRTDAIKAVGGFPSVGISADMDATWALHRAGYRLAYVGEAVAYTVDPETFDDYRQQMNRWASGFFQTMAKHRGQMHNPRSVLVVGAGLFDLMCLPLGYVLAAVALVARPELAWVYGAWVAGHAVVTTVLAASVIGVREALAGLLPYTLVNLYNKWLYLKSFVREWVLDSHYTGWTGRHGRTADVTPVRWHRVVDVAWWLCLVEAVYLIVFGFVAPPLWLVLAAMAVGPWWAMFSVPQESA